MKTTTSIVPLQRSASAVMPKPTQAQIIDVMTHQLIAKRTAENELRKIEREKIQVKLDKEIEKFKKRTIKMGDLQINWSHAGAAVYAQGKSFDGSPVMAELAHQKRELNDLCTQWEYVRNEVKEKMQKEVLQAIAGQPGVKEAITSTINKLGL
jgi:hypothetical protein